MKQPHLASRVRSHRKRAGLSQKDLARIVGLAEARISRHERFGILPPLAVALSYEAVFGVAARDLYPRLYEDVSQRVEAELTAMETELQEMSAKGRQASSVARKLEWCCDRKKPIAANLA
jgi:DNA-binding XRE family transcriptional regulator